MTTQNQTENDILRAIVRKGALADLCKELNTAIQSSPSPAKADVKAAQLNETPIKQTKDQA